MGIKGFYGYCSRTIPECHKTVNIIEEIEKYKSANGVNPVLVINLWTFSYHYHVNVKDLLNGYQLNLIKKEVEEFFGKLKDAGAELIFVFKKSSSDDNEFLKRRLRDYQDGLQLLKKIAKIKSFEKLTSIYKKLGGHAVPYNVLILVAMIQSAKKFGKVHGADSIYCKPSVTQADVATSLNAAWMLGLDTYFFFVPGNWKIWAEDKLNMEKMTIEEYDKEAIIKHFEMDYDQMQMLAILSGDTDTAQRVRQKISDFFGTKNKFECLKQFVKKLSFPVTEQVLEDIAGKIIGKNYNPIMIEDLKKSLASYQNNPNIQTSVDAEILSVTRNDFISFAEELLLNQTAIFITPVFLEFNAKDMVDFNTLVLSWIQKTAGIMLKNSDDREPRKITLLESNDGRFVTVPMEIIFPEFEVPDLKTLMNRDAPVIEKMKMLLWVLGVDIDESELCSFPTNYIVDSLILLYLIKQNSLSLMDARCVLKTLVESRNSEELCKVSTDYPKMINSRALRCSFLYQKCYFILHSCLACFGMKNFCPEITFDGVFFQKMYALNVLNEDEEAVAGTENIADNQNIKEEAEIIPNDNDRSSNEIINIFREIVQDAKA